MHYKIYYMPVVAALIFFVCCFSGMVSAQESSDISTCDIVAGDLNYLVNTYKLTGNAWTSDGSSFPQGTSVYASIDNGNSWVFIGNSLSIKDSKASFWFDVKKRFLN